MELKVRIINFFLELFGLEQYEVKKTDKIVGVTSIMELHKLLMQLSDNWMYIKVKISNGNYEHEDRQALIDIHTKLSVLRIYLLYLSQRKLNEIRSLNDRILNLIEEIERTVQRNTDFREIFSQDNRHIDIDHEIYNVVKGGYQIA